MARAADETRARRFFGAVVIATAILVFITIFAVQSTAGWFDDRVQVTADFRTISGLRPGSPVQLAGVVIGRVTKINFIRATYECVPLTEDVGRHGEGRTDDCDSAMFCAPTGLCADLEANAMDAHYQGCLDSSECGADEICYTSEFRRRSARVIWSGQQNVCVRFSTSHRRVRAELDVLGDALQLIRRDSLAMVASNSVLGDQLVNISPGVGEPLGDDLRVLVRPSLAEDIEQWRARLDRITLRLDTSMEAINEVFVELNDPRLLAAIKGTIEHLDSITKKIANQDGLVGALVGSEQYREDIGVTIAELRSSTQGFESIVGTANGILRTADRNVEPVFSDLQATSRALRTLLTDLQDPKNHSVASAVLYDKDGSMGEDLEVALDNLEEISDALASVARAIDDGKGTVGKVIADPKLRDDVTRLIGNIENSALLKILVRFVLEQQGLGVKAANDPAAPPR